MSNIPKAGVRRSIISCKGIQGYLGLKFGKYASWQGIGLLKRTEKC
ncbi:hypothetical protein C1G87_0395 [Dehalococcoides mccartyi]|uniref:Uncharacterized protein n=1 Tax=Dehalococcoides mccartyi TaxID=61435 RepID=A0A328ELB2_9CHLR|nr:hypothetical protein C1G87_0395 [Dehalococcoides mccartyi]